MSPIPSESPSRLLEATTRGAASLAAQPRDRLTAQMLQGILELERRRDALRQGRDLVTGESGLSPREASRRLAAAGADMIRGWHQVADDAMARAWRAGYGSVAPGAAPALSKQAAAMLARQKGYMSRFGLQMLSGHAVRPGAVPIGDRIAMYGSAVDSFVARGAIDALPPGELITWVLGLTERHCFACPGIAAASPYTVESLPCVPRQGATPCLSQCLCHLTTRPAPGVRVRPETPEDRERGRTIRDRTEGPKSTPPLGRRLPTDEEALVLRDLEQRMAAAVRRASAAAEEGDLVARDRWLAERRDLNARSIRYAEDRDVWWVPTWSRTEVLRSADVAASDVSWLTHVRGIDGTTIHRAQGAAIRSALQAAQDRVKALLDALTGSDLGELSLARARGELSGDDYRGYSEAVSTARSGGGGADEVVTQVMGDGVGATWRMALAVLGLMARREVDVRVGPVVGAGWPGLVAETGLWIVGSPDAVAEVLREVRAGPLALYWAG